MNKALVLLSLFSLSFLTACNLNSADESLKEDLVGLWVYQDFYGGIQDEEGNTIKRFYRFFENNTYIVLDEWYNSTEEVIGYSYLLEADFRLNGTKMSSSNEILYSANGVENSKPSLESLKVEGSKPTLYSNKSSYTLVFEEENSKLTLINCPGVTSSCDVPELTKVQTMLLN